MTNAHKSVVMDKCKNKILPEKSKYYDKAFDNYIYILVRFDN